jgi:hypothetical protein
VLYPAKSSRPGGGIHFFENQQISHQSEQIKVFGLLTKE